ncbi:MAG: YihY/virulence factor BrkB family protein [Flavobacteriales bacterium]|nr:YihY/virulence factor BrkB family protein [Bacteroidota bacterium]MCB9239724.1 YihY/virulence factor BrkB family protein [Flavobacteriales bacterium]
MGLRQDISKRIQQGVKWLQRVSFPGFRGRSVYDVGRFFFNSLFDEDLMLRASSLAFNFFLAIFPSIIFIFTLLAYIPIDNFQDDLLFQVERFLPKDAYNLIISTIDDIVHNQNFSLLSFGFVFALYFSSNAFSSMLTAFNKYVLTEEKRSWYIARWRSIWLTILVVMVFLAIVIVLRYADITITNMSEKGWVNSGLSNYLFLAFQYFSLVLLVYFIFASLYYFGSAKVAEWNFFSVGSTLATLLCLITTAGFTFYVNNFNSYNKLYGSIGTILALMLLIYFNCIVLLVGFELNSSIDRAESLFDEEELKPTE